MNVLFGTGRDIEALRRVANNLMKCGLRPNTCRTYSAAQQRYTRFCAKYQLVPLPATEDTILLYVAFLQQEGLKASSVKVYLAAVRSLHIEEGFGNPLEDYMRVQRAIKALEITSNPPVQKLPITAQIMKALHMTIPASYDSAVTWAGMTLGYFGCLRAAEFCVTHGSFDACLHLTLSDVSLNSAGIPEKHISVRIKRSKTDKQNKGFVIHMSCTQQSVCCYCAVLQMLEYRKHYRLSEHNLSPLLLYSSGTAMTRAQFVQQTRLHLALLGMDTKLYSGHSFRAGSATTAAMNGLPDWQIKLLGRWNSDAYQRYIRTSPTAIAQLSHVLVK